MDESESASLSDSLGDNVIANLETYDVARTIRQFIWIKTKLKFICILCLLT